LWRMLAAEGSRGERRRGGGGGRGVSEGRAVVPSPHQTVDIKSGGGRPFLSHMCYCVESMEAGVPLQI